MKSLLVLLVLVGTATFASTASANVSICSVDLKNGKGRLLQSFKGYGYGYSDACREAKQDCKQVKRARHYRAPVQLCVERPRRPQVNRRACTVAMVGKRGRTIQAFSAVSARRGGINACQKAKVKCQRAKLRQGRRGASCQVISRGHAGRGRDQRGNTGRGGNRGRGGRG